MMISEEDRLRGALHRLHQDEPEPLDAAPIMASARARQSRNRSRIAAGTCALAVVALAGVLLPQTLSSNPTANSGGAGGAQPAPATAPLTPRVHQDQGQPERGPAGARIRDDQWCIEGARPSCHPLERARVEVDLGGTPTLALLAPAGTDHIEPVRPGGAVVRVIPTAGDEPRLVVLQPLAERQQLRAVAADGRVLASW